MGQAEFMMDENGKPQFLLIDKGGTKVNVGSKLSDFTVVKNLGEGHFGSVKLVTSKLTNKLYAMKEINSSRYKTEKQRQVVMKEIKLLENLHHPHVITYFNSFRENNNFYIIIEYINGGSLEDLLIDNIKQKKVLSEKLVWDLLVQALSGLLYLHEQRKIIHRDIKPDNLLLDSEGHLKISDFGVSAIKSEDVDEMLKCHGTVAGPIQFMSPEMALGDMYDFKSDIYMLGLTFFFMMSNRLPEKKITLGPLIIPVKNPNAKLPEFYSPQLREFVNDLLKEPEARPTAREAYNNAVAFYSVKYLKTTSVCSALICLLSIPEMNKYFQGPSIAKKIQSDKINKTEKFIITETFKDAFYKVNPNNFNPNDARLECLKLRVLLFGDKERIEQSPEIELNTFTERLILLLHKELNKFQGQPSKKNPNVNETDEKQVLKAQMTLFTTEYMSKISDQFYYLSKIKEQCGVCNNVIRYLAGINSLCGMYPDKTAKYLGKKNITVIDLFRHYSKTRLFTEVDEFCGHCGKKVDKVNRSKIFYTCPFNFILEICYSDEKSFNLSIDEYINIQEFVERKEFVKFNYYLVGAIYLEETENESKYVSISKLSNGGWAYFNGNTVTNSSFNDLLAHKNLKMLFYTTNAK